MKVLVLLLLIGCGKNEHMLMMGPSEDEQFKVEYCRVLEHGVVEYGWDSMHVVMTTNAAVTCVEIVK